MRIVTPYGRSVTSEEKASKRAERKLRTKGRSESKGVLVDLPEFTRSDPYAVIAAWISVIDKIYKKPKKGKRPSKAQFEARNKLGNACWNRVEVELRNRRVEGIEIFEKIWQSKLHPYPYKKRDGSKYFDEESGKNFNETDWAATFYALETEKVNFKKLAKRINSHLTEKRLSVLNKRTAAYPKGLIEERAEAIRDSTLTNHMGRSLKGEKAGKSTRRRFDVPDLNARINALMQRSGIWSEEGWNAFDGPDDPIAKIWTKNFQLETHDKAYMCRHIWAREAVSIIHEDYGVRFRKNSSQTGTDEPLCMTRREIIETGQGDLLTLYDAMRAYYNRRLKRTKKDGKKKKLQYTLPKTIGSLCGILRAEEENAIINDLIRFGRILHYHSSAEHEDGFQGIEAGEDFLNESLDSYLESSYWTSAGQADIKRTEAFVRVWRNMISHASHTLLSWTDPKQVRTSSSTDILSYENIEAIKKDDGIDLHHARAQLPVLFGQDAGLFTEGEDATHDQKLKDTCITALHLARLARNNIYHFRGRRSFMNFLKELGGTLDDPDPKKGAQQVFSQVDFTSVATLYENDQRRRVERVLSICEGAKLHHFQAGQQLENLATALASVEATNLTLPSYNKLLKGLGNLQKSTEENGAKAGYSYVSNGILTLPPKATEKDLDEDWKLAKFIGSRLIYDRLFRPWLEKQPASRINPWLEKAMDEATNRAQRTAKDNGEHAMVSVVRAKAANQGLISEGDGLLEFFADLANESATEMRVQKAYDSDAEQARKQMKWIEDFKYHILAQAFLAYLSDDKGGKAFNWVLLLNERSSTDIKAKLPDPQKLQKQINYGETKRWHHNLYFLLHMLPVDDASQLLHQFRKWSALEHKGKTLNSEQEQDQDDKEDVLKVISIFSIYLDMSDAKYVWEKGAIEGDAHDAGLVAAKSLFEQPDDFARVFTLQEGEDENRLAATRRGIRQIMRFGHMALLKELLGNEKISTEQVETYCREEKDKATRISKWQKDRVDLHDRAVKAVKAKKPEDFTLDDYKAYKKLVADISDFRFNAEDVRLNTPIRFHRLMMQILARLVDYSATWERDRYFMLLALMKIYNLTPDQVLGSACAAFMASGKIPSVLRNNISTDPALHDRLADFQKVCQFLYIAPAGDFDSNQSQKKGLTEDRDFRNALAHMKVLSIPKQVKSFTELVNQTRQLMRYDRKAKNNVSRSITELLRKEGFEISWTIKQGQRSLQKANVQAKQIFHINAWREAEQLRQKKKTNQDIDRRFPVAENMNTDEKKKQRNLRSGEKRKQANIRKLSFEAKSEPYAPCEENLRSPALVAGIRRLFADKEV